MSKMRADLHNHLTTLKEDLSCLSVPAMRQSRRKLGHGGVLGIINAQDQKKGRYETFVDGLKGTQYDSLSNSVYVPDYGIHVVKGQEIFSEGGHLLVLGLDEGKKLSDYRSLDDSLKEANDSNLTIILDHPFFMDGVLAKNPDYEKYINRVDGIEVHNGESWLPIPGYSGANHKAQSYYDNLGDIDIGAMSFSDGHSVSEIGSSYTILGDLDFSSPENLRTSLKKSVRSHKNYSEDRMCNNYFGVLDHAMKIGSLRVASKLGLFRRVN